MGPLRSCHLKEGSRCFKRHKRTKNQGHLEGTENYRGSIIADYSSSDSIELDCHKYK